MSAGQHSILAPSSGARNVQCPASTMAEHKFPEDESSLEALEGTAAHWVMSEGLEGRLVVEGQIAPNGIIITDEMIEGASLVWDTVAAVIRRFGAQYVRVAVETPVKITRVHDACWGTPDVIIWASAADGLYLFVIDFKFGHGIVEVFENQQTIDYAAGAAEGANVGDMNPGAKVIMVIVQPRAHHKDGPVREWQTTLVDLRAHIQRRSNSAHEALGGEPRFRVGPECEYCRARHACPELQRQAGRAADYAKGAQPLVMNEQALGLELMFLRRARDLLDARLGGLEEQALQIFRAGGRVPLYTIERSPGRERWNKPIPEVLAVGAALGIDIAKPPSAVTPKQAREKGLSPDIVTAYSGRNPGEAKLVFDPTNAATRKIFGGNA